MVSRLGHSFRDAALAALALDRIALFRLIFGQKAVVRQSNVQVRRGDWRTPAAAAHPLRDGRGKGQSPAAGSADSLLTVGGEGEKGATAQMVVKDRRMIDLTNGAKGRRRGGAVVRAGAGEQRLYRARDRAGPKGAR